MPTTENGIPYPYSTGLNDLPEHLENIAVGFEAALAAREGWTSWTPTFVDGPSSVGAGTINGFYARVGNRIHAQFLLVFGAGFSISGSSSWELLLPVTAFDWGGVGNQVSVGSWAIRDNSLAEHWAGAIAIHDSASDSVDFPGAWDGSVPSQRVEDGEPVTIASGDYFSGTLDYRAAS